MSERRERIPAEEVPDPEKWKLPFWTEPNHLVQQEDLEDEEEVLVEEEEIEVEPLTAEQLEAIRQEAYNEGLQQGLVEGRQKGEKQGHEDGYKEGLKAGEEEGRKVGYDAGFDEGSSKAKTASEQTTQAAIEDANTVIEKLSNELLLQKNSLEGELPKIVEALAQAVVMEELHQGSEHITHLVKAALDALPLDSNQIEIQIHPKDLPFIEAAQEQSGFNGKLLSDESLSPGDCVVTSRYSTIDFTQDERWRQVLEQYRNQLQLAVDSVEEDSALLKETSEFSEDASEKQASKIDTTETENSEPDSEQLHLPNTEDPIQSSADLKDDELNDKGSSPPNEGESDEPS